MNRHLVLLGDSILDNAAYVPGRRPAVIDQIRERLPAGWTATLLARDGSVIRDVYRQLDALPGDATHLVLSAGGNDALFQAGILQQSVHTVGEALLVLADALERFEEDYRRLVGTTRDRGLALGVCTIYNAFLADPTERRSIIRALALFNDGIIRVARAFQLPVLDLRVVCTEPGDYVAEIEPSRAGGAKIAEAICRSFVGHDFTRKQTVVFP